MRRRWSRFLGAALCLGGLAAADAEAQVAPQIILTQPTVAPPRPIVRGRSHHRKRRIPRNYRRSVPAAGMGYFRVG
jgi:hypothetical protein